VPVHLRPYRPADLDRLYEICLRTGAAGQDATDEVVEPRLLGEIYAAPYGVLEPEHAFVLDDGTGQAVGYVLGALYTREIEARCEQEWWPARRRRYPVVSGGNGLDELHLCIIHHHHLAHDDTEAAHQSHLPIDLLPEVPDGGWGRLLMVRVHVARRAAGAPGVHLGVSNRNPRDLGFYFLFGYNVISRDAIGHTLAITL
jgi:hypothetical protein